MPTTTAEHLYVYGAVEGAARHLPAPGMPGGGAPRILPISSDVALVVSSVPADTYNAAALEAHVADIDWMSGAATAHHGVIDALFEAGATILPFGVLTVFSSEAAAVAAIRESLPRLVEAFGRIRGRQEWALRISKPDPALAEPETPPPAAESTGAGFLAAKAAARRRDADRARRAAAAAEAAFQALERLTTSVKRTALDGNETLLVDAAFLVLPSEIEGLQRALTDAAADLLRDGCRVSFTGPWPPYSFSHVEGPPHA